MSSTQGIVMPGSSAGWSRVSSFETRDLSLLPTCYVTSGMAQLSLASARTQARAAGHLQMQAMGHVCHQAPSDLDLWLWHCLQLTKPHMQASSLFPCCPATGCISHHSQSSCKQTQGHTL